MWRKCHKQLIWIHLGFYPRNFLVNEIETWKIIHNQDNDGWIISYEWFNNVSPLLRLAPFILLHSHHLRQVQSCCNPFYVISAGFGGVAVLYFIPLVINIVVFSIQIHHLEPLTSTRNSLVCLAFHFLVLSLSIFSILVNYGGKYPIHIHCLRPTGGCGRGLRRITWRPICQHWFWLDVTDFSQFISPLLSLITYNVDILFP